ncbi:ATP-binding protein [Pseudorhodoferax sp. Leaf274]|uniref:ATP-binding protein n=1 Tax=Pseudorhodoferax sp. Leaf274 TaxID=1736318 RepID=UPI0007025172|nr:ATP-binding protein [Pseudorhodoferax sp. Leaf274]KQP47710.1 histidine kinase [Pseudorhodoferax sp. Leaf274]
MATGYSLRRRLLAWVLGASVAAWLVGLAIVVGVAWHESSEVFDEAMEETARLALALGADTQGAGTTARAGAALAGESRLKLYHQLVGADGRVRSRAEDAPAQPFVRGDARRDFHDNVWIDGAYWRVYVERDARSGLTAQVGQPWKERLDLLEEMAEKLAWPALALLLLLGTVCWLAIRRQLAPLERTAAGIAAKSPHDLSPVADAGQPRELRPMLDALNALLGRLGTAMESERRFTADAAHELRTPLAALRMRVQLLERQQAAPAEPLRALREDVDRCTALVESLLALARLDPDNAAPARQAVDLAALFDGLDRGAAQARGITVTQAVEAAALQAEPALLASALRGLLDNAVRYGRPGGRVHLSAAPRPDGGVRLGVQDDGPGVAPADRARLGERFFRVLGTGQQGNGLGLSIVARIAALHGARLHFGDGLDGRGLGVLLDFPAAQGNNA